jgi:quercetin dioxygenase-like cupin family protein
MKTTRTMQLALGVLIFGSGLATGLLAQPAGDTANRREQKRTDLTGAPGMEVVVSLAEYKPGDTVAMHLHHGVEAAYVIQGATAQVPGKPASKYTTGDTLLNLRDVVHAGYTVTGDTALKLFTVHIVDKGKPLYDYTK